MSYRAWEFWASVLSGKHFSKGSYILQIVANRYLLVLGINVSVPNTSIHLFHLRPGRGWEFLVVGLAGSWSLDLGGNAWYSRVSCIQYPLELYQGVNPILQAECLQVFQSFRGSSSKYMLQDRGFGDVNSNHSKVDKSEWVARLGNVNI
jgi:hypothetical protein